MEILEPRSYGRNKTLEQDQKGLYGTFVKVVRSALWLVSFDPLR